MNDLTLFLLPTSLFFLGTPNCKDMRIEKRTHQRDLAVILTPGDVITEIGFSLIDSMFKRFMNNAE